MKIDQKYVILLVIIAIAITSAALFVINKGGSGNTITEATPSPNPTPTPSMSPLPTSNIKPGIVAKEVKDYNYWFKRLDPENRVIAVYNECEYLVPSNLTYKNNTLIMLDNTRSQQTHVLKIGNKDYTLAAGAWNTVTLSSPTLPAKLQIFCKGIEMGQIDLE